MSKSGFTSLLALLLCCWQMSFAQQYPSSFTKISRSTGGMTNPINNNARFGVMSGVIGDLDDDGVVDIAVGASNQNGSLVGGVFILFLKTDGTCKSSVAINNSEGFQQDSFGSSVTTLGDLDDDGVEDIGVGAAYDDDGNVDAGAFWVLFMNKDGSVKSRQKISSTQGNLNMSIPANSSFGSGATAIGDLDGDGNLEIAVGARFRSSGYILFLNNDGTVKKFTTISSGSFDSSGLVGYGIAGLGDVNGDGVPDLAIGGHRSDVAFGDSGAVHIVFLNSNGTMKSTQLISSGRGNFNDNDARLLGVGITGIGDYNGDGVPDMIVGGDDSGSDTGAIWYMMLNSNGTVKSSYKISSKTPTTAPPLDPADFFGSSICFLGSDVNGDGIKDIAIGAFQDDDGGGESGAMWLSVPCSTPSINAGTDFIVCNQASFKLDATGTGKWSVLSGAGTFSSLNDPKATVTFFHSGVNRYVWTGTSTFCGIARDTVKVTSGVNSFAGEDKIACFGQEVGMTAGGPTGDYNTIWTVVSGSGTFTDPTSSVSHVNGLSPGINEFKYTVTNVCGTTSDNVIVTVGGTGIPVNAGDDINVCSIQPVKMNASLPAGTTGTWSIVSGTGNFTSLTDPFATVTDLAIGVNEFKWSVKDSGCGDGTDNIKVTVDAVVRPDAGKDIVVCEGTKSVTLTGSAPKKMTGEWRLVRGAGAIEDETASTTKVTDLNIGLNYFTWSFRGTNYCPNMKDTVLVVMMPKPNPFITMPDTTYTCMSEVALTAKAPNGIGKWEVIDGNGVISDETKNETIISINDDNIIQVKWTVNVESCPIASDTKYIRPFKITSNDVPNVITPNGDRKNDQWKIINIKNTSSELQLFNRWGEEVFSATNYKSDWGGGDLPAGVYFYYINLLECKKDIKGWLSIRY